MNVFVDFPDNSRVWIYPSDRILSDEEADQIQAVLDAFTNQWQAHGKKLRAASTVYLNTFVFIVVDGSQQEATGCSIDASVHVMQDLGRQLNIRFFDRFSIAYEDETGTVRVVSKETFLQQVEAGSINDNTLLFDATITKLGHLKNQWKVPYAKSWHRNMLSAPEVTFHL